MQTLTLEHARNVRLDRSAWLSCTLPTLCRDEAFSHATTAMMGETWWQLPQAELTQMVRTAPGCPIKRPLESRVIAVISTAWTGLLLWLHVGRCRHGSCFWEFMETLSRLWSSASVRIDRAIAGPSQELSAPFVRFMAKLRVFLHDFAYSARNTLIQWCLNAANRLQHAQSNAIACTASKGTGAVVPSPTYPKPSRFHSPPPRVPFQLYSQPPPRRSSATESRHAASRYAATAVELRYEASAIELRYEDFDDAPTAVYHAMSFDDAPTTVYHPIPSRYESRLSKHA